MQLLSIKHKALTNSWAILNYLGDVAVPKLEEVLWCVIGVGTSGTWHFKQLVQIESSEVVAISDLCEDSTHGQWQTTKPLGIVSQMHQ